MEAVLCILVIINLAGRLTAWQIRLRNNTTSYILMDFKDVQEETETTGCAEKAKGVGRGDCIDIFYYSVGERGEDAAKLLGRAQ